MAEFLENVEGLPDRGAVSFWKKYAEGQSEEKLTDYMEDILRFEARALPQALDLSSHQGTTWIKVLTAIIQSAKREKIDMFDLLYQYAYLDGLLDVGDQRLLIATGSC